VGLFRRKQETLNEKLLREAGLDPAQTLGDTAPAPEQQPEPSQPPPLDRAFGSDTLPHRLALGPKEWDATVAVDVPGLGGDRIEFTTIPSGDVIVGEESGDADVSPLADAVEQRVSPPYRATAVRQEGNLWGVGAKRIQVAEIPFPLGERLQLTSHGDDREFRVDSEATHAPVPPGLERVGEALSDSFYVEAQRIDGDLWEVKVSPL
jgi:hypothetical protein